ncbi:macrolide transport system ATP-binding/permease protein [Halopolyspora algeriensis]|uniref:Macrolide transport system ATP-binding/permease protein n=1 Tax=Halopolyspora algeriensis TaxID=1500506 RepID=A0A368VUI4_9ACTN|nr:ABC-F family ATP-binding cassette domain-containing protein [Halopolyspora algeriensis]RCW45744.1 macrolide transport system ATP-binding/permease protein [Halopolyspora algeriensis]TQM54128.1 macrolide transport system ATP-binding/permease protein [Halopolyspora algeriensis]
MSASALLARDLAKSYGHIRVFDGVSITAAPGRRIGLVGDNGVGKSTLLRLLAGVEDPDAGEITRPDDAGFLHQELPFDLAGTVGDVLEDALAPLRAAERELAETAEALTRRPDDADLLATYGRCLEWAQVHEVWDADHRAGRVLDGLGLEGVSRQRVLATLSGGQRSRLGLAALLLRQPGALLLDEPTNHLDDAAISFLQRHLCDLPGVVVLASHDRVFLDAVCTDIVDMDPGLDGPTRYGGAFSDYLRAKHAERARWEQRYAAEQDELDQLRHAVAVTARNVSHGAARGNTSKLAYDYKGARVEKQVSRRVRDARQRLEELDRRQVPKPPAPLRFAAALTSAATTGDVSVQVRRAGVRGRLWIDELDLSGDGRLLITGPNGAGKSSLLYLLAGWLHPESGTVWHRRGLRVGLLEQDVVFADGARTPRRVYAESTSGRGDVPALSELGLLPPRDIDRPVGTLSVGQRRRLALATLIADPPRVLLLDEPTNHLSLTLASELEEALRTAPGATVVASHDRWLRRRWDGASLALVSGRIA